MEPRLSSGRDGFSAASVHRVCGPFFGAIVLAVTVPLERRPPHRLLQNLLLRSRQRPHRLPPTRPRTAAPVKPPPSPPSSSSSSCTKQKDQLVSDWCIEHDKKRVASMIVCGCWTWTNIGSKRRVACSRRLFQDLVPMTQVDVGSGHSETKTTRLLRSLVRY